MPATEKVLGSVHTARPVIERLAKDDDFQENVKRAYESARRIYDEFFTGASPKTIAGRLVGDTSLRDDLRQTIEALSEASKRVRKASEKSHTGRNAVLLTGVMIGLLYAWSRSKHSVSAA